MGSVFFVFETADDDLNAADDEVATDEDTEGEGEDHRMDEGIDTDPRIDDAEKDAPEPAFGAVFFPLDGGVDIDRPLEDEPYRHDVDEEAIGKGHKAGDGEEQDAEDGGEQGECQVEVEFLFGDAVDGADDTEDQQEDGEEVTCFQEGGHGGAGHCHTEERHKGAEDDE